MRQKDIPKEVIIKDSVWKIKFKRDLGSDGDRIIEGLCIPDEKAIFIRQGQTLDERIDTYLHELIHAIEFEYNFRLKHKHVYKLSEALVQIFCDNIKN